MSKVIAICDQKGGVGKTMTTINLGIGMARQGKRVLLADVDAQGSLTASLGYQHPDQLEETLATVLGKVIEDKPLSPGEGILHQEEGIDLLPANIDLSSMGRLYKDVCCKRWNEDFTQYSIAAGSFVVKPATCRF
ncbi:MAG: AAA family ATPase [Acutalibacter sp.]|nr:AAA family ATPase [Acutalibacter sp.]